MSTVKCAACGSSQPAGSSVCSTCGTALPVPTTLDDIEPIALGAPRAGSPPAGAPRPAQSAQNRAAATHLSAGTVIDGKYAIVRLLGQGGMGVVYLARDVHTGIDVVLKSVRSELAHRADVRARTLDEGRVLGQIDHPNVVHLKAVVVDDKSLWLVMQYIDGESLERTIDRYVEQKKHMPLAEALRFFRQVASGVGAAHAEGVIHRDLKPANVLVRKKDGLAKVTDFGIAKAQQEGEGRVQTKGVIGSVWYMSPEQVTGRRDLDKRVDIYALGILLYQMLTGRVPFDADSDYEVMKAQAETPMPLVSAVRSDLPPSVDVLLQKLCAKRREDRFAACEEAVAAVAQIEAELLGQGTTAPPVQVTAAPAKSAPDQETAPGGRPASPKGETAPPVASTRSGATETAPADPPPPTAKPSSRSKLWVGALLVLAAAGVVATLVVTRVIPPPAKWLGGSPTSAPKPPTTTTASASTGASLPPTGTTRAGPIVSASSSANASPAPAAPSFDDLPGAWVGNGDRALDAVKVADTIEFRVKDPAPFQPADYEAGEARFVLRRIPGEESVFAVEDRLRPNPPQDFPFNRDRARSTCQDVRTEAGGSPLRATFDGARLSVELMKIEPTKSNFLFEKGQTISCIGLAKLKATKVISVLSKAKAP